MKKTALITAVLLGFNSAGYALQTAGALAVDLDVNDLAASHGDKITSWTNNGYLNGVFTNATAGQGAVFTTNLAGAAAVEFSGSVNTIMRSDFGVPVELTTNKSWSVETWVYNPTLAATEEVYLGWTPRGDYNGIDGPYYELMELRYYNAGLALEHYAHNVDWGARGRPAAGGWHHIVATRDMATNIEKLYVDGGLNAQVVRELVIIRPDGIFTLGGTQNGAKSGYELFYSGFMGKVRIHTGTLSATQVVQNYLEERGEYGVTSGADALWQGAAGAVLDWNDPANWVAGYVAEGGSFATINNGGIPLLTNSLNAALGDITSVRGGLVVSNNATLSITGDSDDLGSGTGNTYSLTVASGKLEFLGSNTHNLSLGANGATATGLIGVDGTAELTVDKDLYFGTGSGSTGIVTVASNGSLSTKTGWSYLGLNEGSFGKVIVNGGFFGSTQGTLNIMVGHHGGHAELVVNSGLVAANGDLILTSGNASTNSDGRIYLNGGTIAARRIFAEDTDGIAMIYLNGGTIRNRDSRGDFMQNMEAALVQSSGVTFDIIAATTVTAAQPLLEDAGSTGGALTKTGAGTLILGGANTFTGDITVSAGTLWFNNAAGLGAGYSGEIIMNNAAAGLGYNKAGGIAELLALMDTNSVGRITVLSNNAADNIDFSDYPGLTLAFASGVVYTGTYTPYGNTYTLYPTGAGNQFPQVLTGTANVEVFGGAGDQITFTGNSSYSGGTLIDGCKLILGHTNALGTGSITLTNGAVLRLNIAGVNPAFAQRITPESKGFIMLTTAAIDVDLDLAGRPGIIVGTEENNLYYTGTIDPANNEYRLGGGGVAMRVSANRALVISNLEDDPGPTPNKVVIEVNGGVTLFTNNTYSGGTIVTNKGVVHLISDALGAVPAVFDPDNVYINDGCLRLGDADFTINANRGIEVGPGGMELHPWSGHTYRLLGSVSGSGEIFSSDGGSAYLGGANNTWLGNLRLPLGTVGVGDGSSFSWNNASTIQGTGGKFAVRYDGNLTWSSEFDKPLGTDGSNLFFRKMGSGTLTVDVNPVYTRDTTVEGGVLKAASSAPIPYGTGNGNLDISSGASVDVNGYNIAVNGLSGAGSVVQSSGSATTFTAGDNNVSSTFSGSIAPSLELVKTGSGTLTLAAVSKVNDVSVNQGVLAVVNPGAPTGTVTIAGNAILRVTGNGASAGTDASEFTAISSAAAGRLEVVSGAAVALNIGADASFDGILQIGIGNEAALIKRGAGTLSLVSNGHSVQGATSVEEGVIAVASTGGDRFGDVDISGGAEFSAQVLGEGAVNLEGDGLMGYYYDYTVQQPNPYTALDNGVLNTVEAYLATKTVTLIQNSKTSAASFYFGYPAENNVGRFPAGYENTEYFDVIWKGQIVIPTTGSYKFRTNSDDGSMLYINRVLIVNNAGRHGAQWREGTVTLAAGAHDIAITFYEIGGGDHLAVDIDMGAGWQPLPNSMLRPKMFEMGSLSGDGTFALKAVGGGVLVNQSKSATFSGDAVVTNTAVIYKGGVQTLTLTGDNSAHLGGWSIQSGTLQVGDGVTSCILGGSNLYVKAGATLLFNTPTDLVYSGAISGGGSIASIGGGTVTLNGSLTGFTGAMTIGAGSNLEMGSVSVLSISAVTNNGSFVIGDGIVIRGLAIAGSGTTTVSEGGMLDVGANLVLNDLELDGGMLAAAYSENVIGSLAVTTNGNSVLLLGVSTNGQEWGVGDLILNAGANLSVYPTGGLMSRYYDAKPADGSYLTVAGFTNWAAGQTVTIYTNTSIQPAGGLEFGNTGQYFPGKYSAGASNFSSYYLGQIVIPVSGTYTFGVTSDDNGMLFIDDALIVNHNGGHAYTLMTGVVTLTAGVHDFCLLFGQGGGGYGLTAHITIPGGSSQIIPNSMLIPIEQDVMGYSLAAAAVSVINAPGAGTVTMGGSGELRFPALSVELDSHLAVVGAAAVDGATLDVTIDQEIPTGRTTVGDFTATDGVDLSGVTLTLTGSSGELEYIGDKLVIHRTTGTLIMLR